MPQVEVSQRGSSLVVAIALGPSVKKGRGEFEREEHGEDRQPSEGDEDDQDHQEPLDTGEEAASASLHEAFPALLPAPGKAGATPVAFSGGITAHLSAGGYRSKRV